MESSETAQEAKKLSLRTCCLFAANWFPQFAARVAYQSAIFSAAPAEGPNP
jgi:hypothetical protein